MSVKWFDNLFGKKKEGSMQQRAEEAHERRQKAKEAEEELTENVIILHRSLEALTGDNIELQTPEQF